MTRVSGPEISERTLWNTFWPVTARKPQRLRILSSVLLSVFSLRFSAYLRDLCVETARKRRETLLKLRHHRILSVFAVLTRIALQYPTFYEVRTHVTRSYQSRWKTVSG